MIKEDPSYMPIQFSQRVDSGKIHPTKIRPIYVGKFYEGKFAWPILQGQILLLLMIFALGKFNQSEFLSDNFAGLIL